MNGPELIEDNKESAIGAVDRLATNIGIAVLAVIPTLIILIIAPWRTAPLLGDGARAGRRGFILAPGAFFLFTVLTMLMIVAISSPPGAVDPDAAQTSVSIGVVLGPEEAANVAAALREGDAWGAFWVVVPIYFFVVFTGAVTSWATFIVGPAWTIATAVRASFYYFGASLSLFMMVVLAANRFEPVREALPILSPVMTGATILLAAWLYNWFFRSPPISANSARTAFGAGVVGMSIFASIMFANYVVALL